jgi:hypothetical protein
MGRTFLIRHPQIADVAMVFTKLDIARNAIDLGFTKTIPHKKTKVGSRKLEQIAWMRPEFKMTYPLSSHYFSLNVLPL